MIDFFFVRVGFVVRLANTFGDDLGITFLMTCVLAIGTLHSSGVFEKVSAKCTAHDIVELLLDEFVPLLLMNLFLLLSESALAIETEIEWTSLAKLLLETHSKMNSTSRFQ